MPLHNELVAARSEFLAEGAMRGRLYNLGRYSGAVAGGEQMIAGELYRLPEPGRCFRRLDQVEGPEFHRKTMRIFLSAGATKRAWVYLLKKAPKAALPPRGGGGAR